MKLNDVKLGKSTFITNSSYIVCFENPVFCRGLQKETLALSCFLCFTGGSLLL